MSSTFAQDLIAFSEKCDQRYKDVFLACTVEVQRSVVEGSEITGAPGQPIDTGNLRASFIGEHLPDGAWQLTTNVEYAPFVEENVNDVQFKNHGAHSIALTRAGYQRIVDLVTGRVAADNGPIVLRYSLSVRRRP